MTEELFTNRIGSGSAAVLIPGLGYASWFWEAQRPLAERYSLIEVDPRGAGRSPKPPGPYTIAEMAGDVAKVLAGSGEPAHVVGHSMGGYIAQMLALEHPGVVQSLTLVSTTCGGPSHEPVPTETLTEWLAAAHLPPAEYARSTMHLSLRPGWVDDHPDEYDALLRKRLAHPTPTESWHHQFAACTEFLETGLDIGSTEVPVLIVHGDQDQVVPVANAHLLASQLPSAELRVFADAGHLVSLESAGEFNRSVSDFWEAVPDTHGKDFDD